MNEPLDERRLDEERELMRNWQANTLAGSADPSQLAREIAGKVKRFDRKIFWRNFREYAAGAVLFVSFGFQAFQPERRTVAMAGLAAVAFVMIYLWSQHKSIRPLDPAADARTYQAALLQRYDEQIKLLGTVKYWYVLPLYTFAMIVLVLSRERSGVPGGKITSFFIVTAILVFVIWLNEGYGVRKLKAARKAMEVLLEEHHQ